MSDLETLIKERDKILEDIKTIEEKFEGIGKENNNKSTYKINEVSEYANNKILEAIKNQRWYFFKNRHKVLMDRDTGLLWANLNNFKYYNDGDKGYEGWECNSILSSIDEFANWRIPTHTEFWNMIRDCTFPFASLRYEAIYGRIQIENKDGWLVKYNNKIQRLTLCVKYDENEQIKPGYEVDTQMIYDHDFGYLLPCSDIITYNEYKDDVLGNNPIYTENERFKFTLDLFIKNDLWPIFNDENITYLYKKVYFEKQVLIKKLTGIQNQINGMEIIEKLTLSLHFDYTKMLSDYDIAMIDSSVIKYYKAVISWIDDLLIKLDLLQEEKKDIINEFNKVKFELSKGYETNKNLTKEENLLLENRQKFLEKKLNIDIDQVVKKLLSYKEQAQIIGYRIEQINDGHEGIVKLAELDEEKRAKFLLIAENTSNIVMDEISRIEYFEKNKDFVTFSLNLLEEWSIAYKALKIAYKEELSNKCKNQGIEEEVWTVWFEDWCKLRYKIEKQIIPIIKEGLEGNFQYESSGTSIIKNVIAALQKYKEKIDEFYKNDRISIYVNYAFVGNSELQEKFETELKLYEISSEFQSELQNIIFSLDKNINKIFLLNWANNLLDLPIDEVISFIELKQLDETPEKILNQFMELKKRNFATYLSDAKAYAKEQDRRDTEFKNLIFKMRKGIVKNNMK